MDWDPAVEQRIYDSTHGSEGGGGKPSRIIIKYLESKNLSLLNYKRREEGLKFYYWGKVQLLKFPITPGYGTVKDTESLLGGWRKDASQDFIHTVETSCSTMMERFRYSRMFPA